LPFYNHLFRMVCCHIQLLPFAHLSSFCDLQKFLLSETNVRRNESQKPRSRLVEFRETMTTKTIAMMKRMTKSKLLHHRVLNIRTTDSLGSYNNLTCIWISTKPISNWQIIITLRFIRYFCEHAYSLTMIPGRDQYYI
jgi:hypothetical protein